ncbi:hypothetical protein F5J12DRAFT_781711 [Pisolithus orientalis]|uniref:uncharacterized protein n=1 Tax=Pisolithus orientalis TaxID=936130 RepID=UPI002225ACC0|nr:uncharacterized protein F5J12DRAFT_781711 [Pisolithus orientalis]KAI6010705.1 hypothetical protein F5J12DRAFT_781711 [Pisolithus orientalis]
MAATRQPHRALSLTGCFDLQGAAQATPFAISNRLPFPTTGTNERVAEIKHDANFRMKPSLEDMVITPRLLQMGFPRSRAMARQVVIAKYNFGSLESSCDRGREIRLEPTESQKAMGRRFLALRGWI